MLRFSHSSRCASTVSTSLHLSPACRQPGLLLLVGVEDQYLIFSKEMLIAVVARTAAINHQEVIPLFDRQHRVVPDAAMVIDALPAVAAEGADGFRLRGIASGRDHNQKGVAERSEEH